MNKQEMFQERLTKEIQLQLESRIGEEEAEALQKKTPGISAKMRKIDGIAASVIQRAMNGDMAAVRFIFQQTGGAAGGASETDAGAPFAVEFSVVDEV